MAAFKIRYISINIYLVAQKLTSKLAAILKLNHAKIGVSTMTATLKPPTHIAIPNIACLC